MLYPKKCCSFCGTEGNGGGSTAHKSSLSGKLGIRFFVPCGWTDDNFFLKYIYIYLQYKLFLFVCLSHNLAFKIQHLSSNVYYFTCGSGLDAYKNAWNKNLKMSFFMGISCLKSVWSSFMLLKYFLEILQYLSDFVTANCGKVTIQLHVTDTKNNPQSK